jgi:RNA recognition motif-containing protein
MYKLFVSGFPLEITELELAKLIALHGDIDTVKIVRDKKTRVCKGYAFVEMTSLEGAQAAIAALNDTDYGSRSLTLNLVDEKPAVAIPKVSASRSSSYSSKSSTPVNPERKKRPRKV